MRKITSNYSDLFDGARRSPMHACRVHHITPLVSLCAVKFRPPPPPPPFCCFRIRPARAVSAFICMYTCTAVARTIEYELGRERKSEGRDRDRERGGGGGGEAGEICMWDMVISLRDVFRLSAISEVKRTGAMAGPPTINSYRLFVPQFLFNHTRINTTIIVHTSTRVNIKYRRYQKYLRALSGLARKVRVSQ